MALRYLTARLAQQIDEELMGPVGAFSLDQLMELAGLACAQALATVYKKEKYPRVLRLQTQCDNMKITTLPPSPDTDSLRTALSSSDVILDAIFGFSFKGPIRAPFDVALPLLTESGLPIVSVDIPSGWDVEEGNTTGVGLNPRVLVSLTAPKEGVKGFTGRHFLGGRFIPRTLEEKYALNLPQYPGTDQIVELPSLESSQKL
ncbi:hypothetical protein C0989_005571 [Termitomyces sp. Mn162]|nr:hypothetical protein C0989_005571 [Termitomyces sp. Mn162]